ncbi:hypothetical protein L5849_14975, partial [Erythrobacter sp. SN021]|uniref:hypothetical protein n=1 Tax=Erythrobacter sp. SN021 TaxID=2912574 RepID=UPI001F3ACF47
RHSEKSFIVLPGNFILFYKEKSSLIDQMVSFMSARNGRTVERVSIFETDYIDSEICVGEKQ